MLLLLFIWHCASTITYEAEPNDRVTTTTTTKTATTTNRFIYINCGIFLFTFVLLLLCYVVVVLVQLELLIHNDRWTRRITTFNSDNNKQGGVFISACLMHSQLFVQRRHMWTVVCWCRNTLDCSWKGMS